jgi:hypothetical protein
VDRMIREIIATRRPVLADETNAIVDRIASAPFDPRPDVPVPTPDRGLSYEGQILGARASALTYHLVKRVVSERQWAYGTSAEEYLADLRESARSPGARLAVYWRRGGHMAGILAENRVDPVRRGPEAQRWLLIVFSADRGYDGFWIPDIVNFAVEHTRGRHMAYVGSATHADVDHLLERATAAWAGLVEVEREIDSWDVIDQIVYVEEWQIQDDRLKCLAQYAQSGIFTDAQRVRYQDLLSLVERNRPIIDRLLRV